jgi:lysophospholipase L1-like esterase
MFSFSNTNLIMIYRKCLLLSLVILLMAFVPQQKKITVWMIGDSTMSIKETRNYPETGWGMPFVHFFDSSVTVENRAKNGRGTKTFITEKLWEPIAAEMKEGDYLLIQFGHNDEVKTKKSYSTEEEFRNNLTMYVNTAKSKKAKPVLITPAARRNFDSATAKVVGTHDVYAAIIRSVAKDSNVPLIDLDAKSQALLQKMGVENSKLLFNQLQAGEHPNYPKGVVDNTHFSELGARMMAQIVLAEMRDLKLDLVDRLVKK